MTTWKPKLAESQSFNSKFFLAENLWSDVSTTLFTDFRRAMENLRDYEVNVWFRKYPYLARIYRGLSICTSSRVCLNCSVAAYATQCNSPFPNYLLPLFQSEAWCSSFHMKIIFICMWMKTNFHLKRWAPGLALKKRPRTFGFFVDCYVTSLCVL